MRRLSACLAALLVLLAGCGGLAAPEIDFSEMTLDELYAVRARLDAAIEALEKVSGSYYDDGSYLVSRDIPEGNYVLVEREGALFASVLVRAGDTDDTALILHKLISAQADIHLTRNTWVTLSGVRAVPMHIAVAGLQEESPVGEGAYLVGAQLSAGEYEVAADGKAPLSSYSVYSGILGTDAQLIKFEVIHAPTTLTLADGNYVELSGCTMSRIE